MALIKSVDRISAKWAAVTPQRAPQYEEGVASPVRDWATETVKAKEAYKAGVVDAIAKDRFAKGVTAAGTDKWKRRATEVGPRRFAEGVAIAQPEYEKGFKPYRDVIERTTLPARFAKGDPRNIDRVRVMAAALADAKRK